MSSRSSGNTMQLRFTKREQLVEALKARRQWAERHDADAARKHRQDEDAVLKTFREECRDLAKMNLANLKTFVEKHGYRDLWPSLPSCPMAAVTMLDEVMAALAITRQETFILNGDYRDPIRNAHWLLTHSDEPKKATVCA